MVVAQCDEQRRERAENGGDEAGHHIGGAGAVFAED